jgi:hypothetical protein
MWGRVFNQFNRQGARFARQANAPFLSRVVHSGSSSSGATSASWNTGLLVGAGALGITCAYLTTHAFALSQDPVSILYLRLF